MNKDSQTTQQQQMKKSIMTVPLYTHKLYKIQNICYILNLFISQGWRKAKPL